MDPESILKKLREELAAAQESRDAASKLLSGALQDFPSGIPTSESADRVRRASGEYGRTQKEATAASSRLNAFLTREANASKLQRISTTKNKNDPGQMRKRLS